MVAFLAPWVKSLVIFLLVSSLLLMLMPDTDLKRFLRMVVGLLLIALVIQPLISGELLKTSTETAAGLDMVWDSWERGYPRRQERVDLEAGAERLVEKGSGAVREYMENQTNRQVGSLLGLFAGIHEAQVISQVNSKGQLERVVVQLQLEAVGEDDESNRDHMPDPHTYPSIRPVAPVVIMGSSPMTEGTEQGGSAPLVRRVQRWVADFFGIDDEQVVVSIL